MLHDTTDPLHDTVIMPIGGYTHGRGFKVHAYRFNNCKEKQKQKNFKKKEKQPNARCICTVSLLHCTLEGGLAAPSPHPANQGQNPTSDVVTRTLLYSAAMAPPPMATAFELWCWRRLLRVPWTARRSNQSILKEISPEYSLEGLMLKLKLQYFGHPMRRTD